MISPSLPHLTSSSSTSSFYTHLTRHIVPGPNSANYFTPFFLLPLALLTPPSLLSRRQLACVFLPLMYASLVREWAVFGIDVLSVDLALWGFVLLVCRDVRGAYRRVWVRGAEGKGGSGGEKGGGGEDVVVDEEEEEAYPESLAKRIPWVFTLLVSLRLNGWKIGDPSHDKTQPPARMSRAAYMRRAGGIAVTSYLILDVAASYAKTDPYFTTSGMSIDHPFPAPTAEMASWLVMLRLLPPRLVRSSALAGEIYAMVTEMFYLPLFLTECLNTVGFLPYEWSPHAWPLPFGNFSAIPERGLRGLWGDWWHGVNRQFTAPPGRWLAQTLGIPTRSTTGYALLAISAFFFSGVMHMGLIPPEPQTTSMSATLLRLHVGGFFWAQIPAFGVEMAVSKLVARYIPQALNWSVTGALVMAWTAAWLCLTLPLLAVPFRELSYWHQYPVPVSLLQGLSGKGWWTWSI